MLIGVRSHIHLIMPCPRSGADSAGMVPTDRAAAVRSAGKLAALMPVL